MSERPHPEPSAANAEERAREYESIHNRLFLVRVFLTLLALAIYLFTGASQQLAAGLAERFGQAWYLVNAVYTLVTVFAFIALMFPLSLYSDHVIEHRYGLSRQSLGSWFFDFLKSLAIELVLVVGFFSMIYALLRWSPHYWWMWSTLFYVIFVVVLTAIAPVVIMPMFHKFEPLEDQELTAAVKSFVERSGLQVLGVYRWGLEEKTNTANAALTGLGRTRRIVLGDTMLKNYSHDEIISVLAHEVGHYKFRDLVRLIVAGSVVAALGSRLAHLFLQTSVQWAGFASAAEIGSFPLFVFSLFVFSLVIMPFSNAYSRRREYAADAYAVRAMGSAAPLVSALQKLADQNLADPNPPAWIEFLLHSHPSISRRVRRAEAAASENREA